MFTHLKTKFTFYPQVVVAAQVVQAVSDGVIDELSHCVC